MQNNIIENKLIQYGIPSGLALSAFIFSAEKEKIPNAFKLGLIGLFGVHLLNQSAENNILNVYANRDTYRYSADAKPRLSNYGIDEVDPILPLPTDNVSVANTIDLPNGRVIIVPPPSDPVLIPVSKPVYGAPVSLSPGAYSAVM